MLRLQRVHGCPAGKGPVASCKHVGALCYAFAEFCPSGKLPEFFTDIQILETLKTESAQGSQSRSNTSGGT